MSSPRWVFISPHLDDAALSCGGLISDLTARGTPCLNITITAGIPELSARSKLIDDVQRKWGFTDPAEAVRIRKDEDIKAMAILGCQVIHLDFLDAIYRKSKDGDFFYSSIFDSIHPDELYLPQNIARSLTKYLRADDILLLPLALGKHIDHLITREAARFLDQRIYYYIDVPYIFSSENDHKPMELELYTHIRHFGKKYLRDWVLAIQCYSSQLSSLFEDSNDLERKITNYYFQFEGIILLREGS